MREEASYILSIESQSKKISQIHIFNKDTTLRVKKNAISSRSEDQQIILPLCQLQTLLQGHGQDQINRKRSMEQEQISSNNFLRNFCKQMTNLLDIFAISLVEQIKQSLNFSRKRDQEVFYYLSQIVLENIINVCAGSQVNKIRQIIDDKLNSTTIEIQNHSSVVTQLSSENLSRINGNNCFNYFERPHQYSQNQSIIDTNQEIGIKINQSNNKVKEKQFFNQILIENRNKDKDFKIIQYLFVQSQLKIVCKVKIQKVKMWIGLGLIDTEAIYSSLQQTRPKYIVFYRNDGYVWDGTTEYVNQGKKFIVGEQIEIFAHFQTRKIEWKVKGQLRYSMTYKDLSKQVRWRPFVYFYAKGDQITILRTSDNLQYI